MSENSAPSGRQDRQFFGTFLEMPIAGGCIAVAIDHLIKGIIITAAILAVAGVIIFAIGFNWRRISNHLPGIVISRANAIAAHPLSWIIVLLLFLIYLSGPLFAAKTVSEIDRLKSSEQLQSASAIPN